MIKPTPAPELSPLAKHVKSLDGLRGLAVLAVMASHLFQSNMTGGLRPLKAILEFGATGVDLFFVLSGFLITGILFDSLGDSGYFRKFYARRTLRIFPLYYGVLFVCFALTPWLGTQWHHMKWVLLFYLQNTNIAGPFYSFGISDGVSLDHFWSLAVEEQFYLVWPLAVFLIRRLRPLLWTCLLLSGVALGLRLFLAFHHAIHHTINRSTLCRMDSLLVGAALALLMRSSLRDRMLRYAPALLAAAIAVLVLLSAGCGLVKDRPAWSFASGAILLCVQYTLLALGCAALIAWCLRASSLPRRIFEGRTLRFFGKYSYGLYVLHFVALGFLLRTFRGWIMLVTHSKGASVAGAGLLVFVIAVAAAYASYHLYEKRFLGLKRYFDYERPSNRNRVAREDIRLVRS